jgi:hypothetical protein
VRFLKAGGDKEPGQDLLELLEASPIRESNEYGFMLWESGLFVYVMLKKWREGQRIKRTCNGISKVTKMASMCF